MFQLLNIYKLLYRIVRLSCQSSITRKVCIMLLLRNCKMQLAYLLKLVMVLHLESWMYVVCMLNQPHCHETLSFCFTIQIIHIWTTHELMWAPHNGHHKYQHLRKTRGKNCSLVPTVSTPPINKKRGGYLCLLPILLTHCYSKCQNSYAQHNSTTLILKRTDHRQKRECT